MNFSIFKKKSIQDMSIKQLQMPGKVVRFQSSQNQSRVNYYHNYHKSVCFKRKIKNFIKTLRTRRWRRKGGHQKTNQGQVKVYHYSLNQFVFVFSRDDCFRLLPFMFCGTIL